MLRGNDGPWGKDGLLGDDDDTVANREVVLVDLRALGEGADNDI